jgi:hypothetical protein
VRAEYGYRRVSGRLVEARDIPAVVEPVHVEEHADDAVLQVRGIARVLRVVIGVVEGPLRARLSHDVVVVEAVRGYQIGVGDAVVAARRGGVVGQPGIARQRLSSVTSRSAMAGA